MHRQLRALEVSATSRRRPASSPRPRRLAVDLMRGRFDTADYLRVVAREAAGQVYIADGEAVGHAMTAYPALMAGDQDTCAREALAYEEFGLAEGAPRSWPRALGSGPARAGSTGPRRCSATSPRRR
jgi:hypothetical protein